MISPDGQWETMSPFTRVSDAILPPMLLLSWTKTFTKNQINQWEPCFWESKNIASYFSMTCGLKRNLGIFEIKFCQGEMWREASKSLCSLWQAQSTSEMKLAGRPYTLSSNGILHLCHQLKAINISILENMSCIWISAIRTVCQETFLFANLLLAFAIIVESVWVVPHCCIKWGRGLFFSLSRRKPLAIFFVLSDTEKMLERCTSLTFLWNQICLSIC